MERETLLAILKSDLEIATAGKDGYLSHLLDAAAQMIAREGIHLGESAEDVHLQIQYAAYLYRKRKTGEPMPRMLRYALNNRLIAEKAGGGNAP